MFATSAIGRDPSRTSTTICSLNSLLNYRSQHNTDSSASHVRINSGFSPLSTKHRALHRVICLGALTGLATIREPSLFRYVKE